MPPTETKPLDSNYFFNVGKETIPEYNARIEKYNASKNATPPAAVPPQTPTPAPTPTPEATPPKRDLTGSPTDLTEADVTSGSIEDLKMKRLAQDEQEAKDFNTRQEQIMNGAIPLSPDQQAQIDGLKAQFKTLIDQQTLMNTNAVGEANIRGYQKGAGENALFATNMVNTVASAGISKVATLQTELASAVGQLTQAFKKDNVADAKAAYDTLQTAQDAYNKGLDDYVTEVGKAIQQRQDALAEQQKADALVAKDLQDEKNNVMEAMGKSGKKIPPEVYDAIKNATDPTEVFLAAGDYMHSESDVLDAKYKQAQIDKIYHDISTEGIGGMDASGLVAYASQYAATGQIPGGLPKGTFGTVAQVAKELPKAAGEIISIHTGVKPTGDTGFQDGIAAAYSTIELAKQLKELDSKRHHGLLAGLGTNALSLDENKKYIDLRSQIIDLLSRARSGAALTPSEEELYSGMLPGRFSKVLGVGTDPQLRIDNFINAISSDIQGKSSAKGWAINGLSHVKVGDNTFIVGDVVQIDGQNWRVNPDGTATKVQ